MSHGKCKPDDFVSLLGKIIDSIERVDEDGDETLIIKCSDRITYKMFHYQDCCESVGIEDICGDINDLIGSPILYAKEASSSDIPPKYPSDETDGSFTWTFYKLATVKGWVDIRWYGTSNGYYSEDVSFMKVIES